jgi:queuine tRNA-ribosyltransferase
MNRRQKHVGFEVVARDQDFPLMRAGKIRTEHGEVDTPAFSPVASYGYVKQVGNATLSAIGMQLRMTNSYLLFGRGELENIFARGGLANYEPRGDMVLDEGKWTGATISDSGGFQVMSDDNDDANNGGKVGVHEKYAALSDDAVAINKGKNVEVEDGGVWFNAEWNKSANQRIFYSPERAMESQHKLGADMFMAFDQLTNLADGYNYNVEALERTRKWAVRCMSEHVKLTRRYSTRPYQMFMPVIQGGHWRDLREKAATDMANLRVEDEDGDWEPDGFGLGGSWTFENLGEEMSWTTKILPENKPRHLLGISDPEHIFVGVENGADTFDCVAPTREARNGRIYTTEGNRNITSAFFANSHGALDEQCDCPVCSGQIRELDEQQLPTANFAKYEPFGPKWNGENLDAENFGEKLHYEVDKYTENFANRKADFDVELFAKNLHADIDDNHATPAVLRMMSKSKNRELTGKYFELASVHNIRFMLRLMEQIRENITAGTYQNFKDEFMNHFYYGEVFREKLATKKDEKSGETTTEILHENRAKANAKLDKLLPWPKISRKIKTLGKTALKSSRED